MATFRFRVLEPTGFVAGFRDEEMATEFAKVRSMSRGMFVTVLEFPHGKGREGARQIAAYLHGDALSRSV